MITVMELRFSQYSRSSFRTSMSQLPPSLPFPHPIAERPHSISNLVNNSLLASDSVFVPLRPTIPPRRRPTSRSFRSELDNLAPPVECCVSLESSNTEEDLMPRTTSNSGLPTGGITECSQVILDDEDDEQPFSGRSHSPTLAYGWVCSLFWMFCKWKSFMKIGKCSMLMWFG